VPVGHGTVIVVAQESPLPGSVLLQTPTVPTLGADTSLCSPRQGCVRRCSLQAPGRGIPLGTKENLQVHSSPAVGEVRVQLVRLEALETLLFACHRAESAESQDSSSPEAAVSA